MTRTISDEHMLYLYKSEEGFRAIMEWYEELVKQINIPVASEYVDTRFGRTHMLVCGPEHGVPVVLIQGVASAAPLWRHQLPSLAKYFRVYALDTVGQPGRSAPNPLSFLNNEYREWLTDVIDGLVINKANFMGISTGSWNVMRMAVEKPERVRKVILLSPMGIVRARLPWRILVKRVMKKSKNARVLEDELTAKTISGTGRNVRGSFGVFDRQVARAMALGTRHLRMDRVLKICNAKTGNMSYAKALRLLRLLFLSEHISLFKKIHAECLVLFGEHDILYNPCSVAERIKRFLPRVDTCVIKGSGHGCIYDQPEESNRTILSFLLRN